MTRSTLLSLALTLAAGCATTRGPAQRSSSQSSQPTMSALARLVAAQSPEPLETAPNQVTTHEGTLGDRAPASGAVAEAPYAILLTQGERVRIDLHAGYDTVLRVLTPDGRQLENDDVSERDLSSRVEFTAEAAGLYRVVSTAYASTARGAFELKIYRGSAVASAEGSRGGPRPDPSGSIGLQEHAEARSTLDASARSRTFRFVGRRGDWVELETRGASFDTVLELRGPLGESWQNDDRVSGDLHSRIAMVLPSDGTYVARVRGYRETMTGSFGLRFDRDGRPANETRESARIAGERGRGQVYGLFFGIQDYGPDGGNLPHCDEDATELARVLRERGIVPASRQIVLTNQQVTPAAVRAAIAQMASRVGEDDLFVVFYSGHGRQQPTAVSAMEPDGLDETIALRGGGITDDEMASLLAPVRGEVLLALDSCYSGGFARDVVSRPRRIGLFASDEDVLSQVAGRFAAGGYLSYWLRGALSGDADRDRDGLLLVGELCDYVLDRFAQYRGRIETTGNGDYATQQHPRIERGSVAPGALLLRLPDGA